MTQSQRREQQWLSMSREQQLAAAAKAQYENAQHYDKVNKGRTHAVAELLYNMRLDFIYGNHSG